MRVYVPLLCDLNKHLNLPEQTAMLSSSNIDIHTHTYIDRHIYIYIYIYRTCCHMIFNTSSSRIHSELQRAFKNGPSLHSNLIPLTFSTGKSEPNKSLMS